MPEIEKNVKPFIHPLEAEAFKTPLKEEYHLLNIKNDEKYRGWYQCILYKPTGKKVHGLKEIKKHHFFRFRLPPILNIYNRKMTLRHRDRIIGVHRFLMGKDLLEENLGNDNLENLESINEEKLKDILSNAEKVITFDCNQIPYLEIVTTIYDQKDLESDPYFYKFIEDFDHKDRLHIEEKLNKHISKHPNYTKIFEDVINEKISPKVAKDLSKGLIYQELKDDI